MATLKIELRGVKELQAKLNKMNGKLAEAAKLSSVEISAMLLKERGGGKSFYPAETSHNKPPVPYYIRGVGEQWGANYNDNSSEKMNTKFYTTSTAKRITIGNRAIYAQKTIGENQDPFFRGIGWARLLDVAKSQLSQYAKIYERKLKEIIKRLGL